MEKLESAQYSAAQAISGTWKGTSTEQLCAELGRGSVYTIPFSFHIGLVSYRIGPLFTRYRFHSISDWPPV